MKNILRQDFNRIPTRSSIAGKKFFRKYVFKPTNVICKSDVPSVHEIQNGLKMLDVDTRDTIFKQIHPLHLRRLYCELKHGHMVYLGNNGHVVMARSEGPNKNLIIAEGRGVRCALWSRSRGLDLPTNFSGPGWTWPAKDQACPCCRHQGSAWRRWYFFKSR